MGPPEAVPLRLSNSQIVHRNGRVAKVATPQVLEAECSASITKPENAMADSFLEGLSWEVRAVETLFPHLWCGLRTGWWRLDVSIRNVSSWGPANDRCLWGSVSERLSALTEVVVKICSVSLSTPAEAAGSCTGSW